MAAGKKPAPNPKVDREEPPPGLSKEEAERELTAIVELLRPRPGPKSGQANSQSGKLPNFDRTLAVEMINNILGMIRHGTPDRDGVRIADVAGDLEAVGARADELLGALDRLNRHSRDLLSGNSPHLYRGDAPSADVADVKAASKALDLAGLTSRLETLAGLVKRQKRLLV